MNTCHHCNQDNPKDAVFCIECGKALKLKDNVGSLITPRPGDRKSRDMDKDAGLDLAPGSMFAERYEIVEMIGQGGMGVVYRASEKLGSRTRDIALKLIHADRLEDEQAVDRLVSEGVVTQDIRHPNVVAVYNVGVAGKQPFVAMEFVEGASLRDWIRGLMNTGDEASLETVAALLRNMLEGLSAAHDLGIIHRDLKPENIILPAQPSEDAAPLKILDFGIARAPGTLDSGTGTGLGTPNYMAPEQITNAAAAKASADLYSVSVIFYELLMGVLPKGHWQPPSGGRGDVPEAIDQLIQDGLSNRPLSRPQSTGEYRQRLDAAMGDYVAPVDDGVAPPPSPPPPPPPSAPFDMKKALIWGGGGLAVLAGLGALIEDEPVPVGPEWEQQRNVVLDEETGLFFDEDGEIIMPEEGFEPDPPPPPPQLSLSDYSGRWNYAQNAFLNISAQDNGNFSGTGRAVDGTPIEVSGSLSAGSFTIYSQTGNQQIDSIPFNGRFGAMSSPCDIPFETFNPDGSLNWSDVFHVDHPASQTLCPARFQQ